MGPNRHQSSGPRPTIRENAQIGKFGRRGGRQNIGHFVRLELNLPVSLDIFGNSEETVLFPIFNLY
jgi:hypothetical protein